MNSTPPPSLPPPTPPKQPHTMLRVRARSAVCGLQCRAEVMGSSRKVRSRVHGGVIETRPWLLFAFFFSPLHNSASFLPTEGCVQCATVLTPQQPRHRTDPVCFSAFIKSSPGRKTTNITTSLHWALVSLALRIPPWLPEKSFVFVLVKSGVYLYPLTDWLFKAAAVCAAFFFCHSKSFFNVLHSDGSVSFDRFQPFLEKNRTSALFPPKHNHQKANNRSIIITTKGSLFHFYVSVY